MTIKIRNFSSLLSIQFFQRIVTVMSRPLSETIVGKGFEYREEHLPLTLLPTLSSSVPLVTLDLTSQAADRGAELTSAQVTAGCPHSQIRHLVCVAQTVDTETHGHNRSRPSCPRAHLVCNCSWHVLSSRTFVSSYGTWVPHHSFPRPSPPCAVGVPVQQLHSARNLGSPGF